MTDGYHPDFLIGFYRKQKYSWEFAVKPAIVVHFYEMPDVFFKKDRRHCPRLNRKRRIR
jgi:hypothetical protein